MTCRSFHFSPHRYAGQSIQSWTVVMIVVPWVLLMVGVATAVILGACKKGMYWKVPVGKVHMPISNNW